MAVSNLTASTSNTKLCSCCKSVRLFSDFYKDKKTKDGMYSRCKACHNETTSKWSKLNRPARAEAMRNLRAKNPEKHRAYNVKTQAIAYARDPEKYRERSRANRAKDPEKTSATSSASRAKKPDMTVQYMARYYEKHKDRLKPRIKERANRLREELKPINCEKTMRRNARKIQASPAWADLAAMQAIYVMAAKLTLDTGIKHHVDHVVPLQSRKVCGLHVEHNLQILTARQNQEKSNKWLPDIK